MFSLVRYLRLMKNSNASIELARALSRRTFMTATGCGLMTATTPSALLADSSALALKTAAARRGLRFGSAARVSSLGDDAFVDLLEEQCNVAAALNAFKWHVMEKDGVLDFSETDRFAAYAYQAGFRQRGHALIWDRNRYSPQSVREAESAGDLARLIEDRCRSMVSRYAGVVQSWDVVNEAVHWDTGRLERGPFSNALGIDYVDLAFRVARGTDPSAELVYNDYVRPARIEHQSGILRFLDELGRRDVPIDAIGIQGHLWLSESRVDYDAWRRFLDAISARGLKILITELDVVDNRPADDQALRDRLAADYVQEFLDVTLDNRAVTEVVVRSLTDKYEGLSWALPRTDGRRRRPSPFDANNRPKPIRDALLRAFAGAPKR